MTPLIHRPGLRRGVLLAMVVAIVLSLLQPTWQFVRPAGVSGAQSWLGVEMAMLPKDNKNTFNISLDMPAPTPLETTDRAVREIGAVLRENALILNYQSWIGEAGVIDFNGLLRGTGGKAGPQVAELRVNLIDKTERSTTSIEIVRELRQRLLAIQSRYPGSVIQLVEDSPGPPVRAMVMAEIYGPELGPLRAIGKQVEVQIPRRHQLDPALLARVYLVNRQGKPVPLSELVRRVPALADRPIQHKDGERVVYVGGELVHTAPVYAVLDLDRRLDGLPLPGGERLATGNLRFNPVMPDTIDGYRLLWDGEIRMTLDSYRDMLGALGLALTLVYLVLVAYYQSFAIPLVAMAAIPLGLAGIFPGHWLMGQSFTATSMIGVIALAGVVVRNSLLIIDFVLDYRRQGLDLREAILEAGAVRLRPILLTALAIMLGSAVMLTDPVFGGLAISLIFGTLVSTVLTLIVVPLLLYLLLRYKDRKEAIMEKGTL
jgi:multidrug efflux pump subunit AcrB